MNNPNIYKQIESLSTTYKLLTSFVTEYTYSFFEQKNVLPCKQKGCRKKSYGCKDQLLINNMIIENSHKKKIEVLAQHG